jgi:hypothetical protein
MLMALFASIVRVIIEHKNAEAGQSICALGTVILVIGISCEMEQNREEKKEGRGEGRISLLKYCTNYYPPSHELLLIFSQYICLKYISIT